MRNDFFASISVFLVGVPLCLGIALASGAPLFAGILSGAIGAIIVAIISDSKVCVSGPASGMVAIVLMALQKLGSFDAFLLSLMLAGILQILSGILRAGFIANFVPSTVIKGLLAATGILIIIKQLPIAIGYFATADSVEMALRTTQENLNLAPLLFASRHWNYGATIITFISLAILFLWDKKPLPLLQRIPAPCIVVFVAVLINKSFSEFFPYLSLKSSHLVNIPNHTRIADIFASGQHPRFMLWNDPNIYLYALMIAVVASLETLLNLEAIEKLDKRHRYCSRDRELVAQGIGNTISGLLGGLPITAVIARSSVNINAGGHSKLSVILHGVFLILSMSLFIDELNLIPLAALAAILIYTGCQLAHFSLFKSVYREGTRHFVPFIITVLAIVFTNLLSGIVIGLFVSVAFILHYNSRNCFTMVDEKHPVGDVLRLILPQQATFLNRAAIIDVLNKIPWGTKVIIDAKATDYIDEDVLEVIRSFTQSLATEKNISINFEGLQRYYDIRSMRTFINATTYHIQSNLTPETILTILKEGNQRFILGTPIHKNYKQQITATATSQHPIAVILSCIDSRVPVELIFDLSLGDVFVVRVAGNIVNEDILGSIEFACHIAGAKMIVVLGHKSCGAIKAACDNFSLGHISHLVEKIKPAIALEQAKIPLETDPDQFILNVTRNNVQLSKQWLFAHSSILRDLIVDGRVGLISAIYDVATGEIEFDDTPLKPTIS